ncbi:ParB/RepB/Spo0J family partition protein [Terriglobus roseus]|uniref:ParB-like nuclease domain-containing protein n=1 Tax=Terriglobus roseus TaxID=392734 RepID=A0A1H4JE05_9BACT|nr:plasmid partitioning protein RepB C-terminal domain-containing protein [Terriglobus roseus]SEB44540.1 ParB-like nuclease domain-containing protein [Terriglobus roseus]
MDKSRKQLRSAFQREILTLPLSSILPQKNTDPKVLRSTVFKQILASVREVGLIESLVVYPQDGKGFLLLDGHLRLEALRMLGVSEAACILSTDDESYTYNKRVNHIPPVAQHLMLLEAMKSGLTEDRIAAALNIDVATVKNRAQMLDGICPEVVEMLRNQKLSVEVFPILRKMKPIGQIATVELMMLRNDYSVSFAKTRLAISPPSLLSKVVSTRQLKANADAADALLAEDTESLIQNLRAVEETYGMDVLTLTVACAYFERLFAEPTIVRYLSQHHQGPMETLRSIVTDIRARTASESAA